MIGAAGLRGEQNNRYLELHRAQLMHARAVEAARRALAHRA